MKKYCFCLFLLLTLTSYGQDSEKESSFKLYPNPAVNDIVYITTTEDGVKDVIVYDVFGEIVLTDRISSRSLNISRLVAGVYVLQVKEKNISMTRKLVVK